MSDVQRGRPKGDSSPDCTSVLSALTSAHVHTRQQGRLGRVFFIPGVLGPGGFTFGSSILKKEGQILKDMKQRAEPQRVGARSQCQQRRQEESEAKGVRPLRRGKSRVKYWGAERGVQVQDAQIQGERPYVTPRTLGVSQCWLALPLAGCGFGQITPTPGTSISSSVKWV